MLLQLAQRLLRVDTSPVVSSMRDPEFMVLLSSSQVVEVDGTGK